MYNESNIIRAVWTLFDVEVVEVNAGSAMLHQNGLDFELAVRLPEDVIGTIGYLCGYSSLGTEWVWFYPYEHQGWRRAPMFDQEEKWAWQCCYSGEVIVAMAGVYPDRYELLH
ncbi:hypothetical protein OL229_10485 [Neisseriaceae bacterium JH1-16]|nr:hypothetical protein [Neisseriaceae bacterium JH1-16]